MPKERGFNPAQAHRKAEKQKEIAKSRKNVQAQRNEKLARRNPERLQRQIDELKEAEERGALRPKDKEMLAQLEKDVRGIRRAREALGDAAPQFASHAGASERRDARYEQQTRRQNLGKRRHDEEAALQSDDSDTDPEARDIPMPRDTPPPAPRAHRQPFVDPRIGPDGRRVPHALPTRPTPMPPAQTTYSSAPQLRDLKKEATKFVPSAVAQQKKRVKGEGRLLEPEEIEKLEKAGYYAAEKAVGEAAFEAQHKRESAAVQAVSAAINIDEEMKRFEQEMDDIYSKDASQRPLANQAKVEDAADSGD